MNNNNQTTEFCKVDLSGKYSSAAGNDVMKCSPLQTLVTQHKFNILMNVLVTFHFTH
jgi:hypothetical protein